MSPDVRLLVELLAAQDAVWRPLRRVDWVSPMPAVLYEFRQCCTLPWRPSDASARGRKQSERRLAELIEAKLVATTGRDRRSQVSLTDLGDATARALADLPDIEAGLESTREVDRLGAKRVSELALARLPAYTDSDECRAELALVEYLALPALCRGWLEAESDCHGRVFFTATEAGRTAATQDHPTIDLPSPNDEAARLYDEHRTEYRNTLRTRRPNCEREIGPIPLPVSKGA